MLLDKKRVFVIEDDVVNMAIVVYLLKGVGATVFRDHWGLTTVKSIQQAMPIDLILLDLNFPRGVSGFDIFDHLRAEPQLAEIPIVAVSASGEINKARDKGFNGYIGKPIIRETFAENLRTVLEGSEVWAID
jgi:two-component system, cell cycle response regulator DivK